MKKYAKHDAHAATLAAAELVPDEPGGAIAMIPAESALPDLRVQVNEGQTLAHEGEPRGPSDEFTLPGPSAHHLADRGFVTILGEA